MNEDKVSVLMSVYNGAAFLCEAIESVLNQTYQNFELIVIDDASTDNSWQIACDYLAHDSRIKTLQNPINQGASAALNLGLQCADGDYLTRLDCDDIMLPERLAQQINYLQQYPEIGALGTNIIFIDLDGDQIGQSSFPLPNEVIQESLPDYMCFCGPTLLVRRRCFTQCGYYYVEAFATAEDYDLCLRLSEVTQMANLERPLYLYRQHPSSVSIARRHYQMFNKVRSLEQAVARRFGSFPPRKYIDYIARDYLRAAVLSCTSDNIENGRKCLATALHHRPDILHTASMDPSLDKIIMRYLPQESLDTSLLFLECVFGDLLPKQIRLSWLKSRLASRIFIDEAFKRASHSEGKAFDAELIWKGIKHNPGWLTNRGVASILTRDIIFRLKTQYTSRSR